MGAHVFFKVERGCSARNISHQVQQFKKGIITLTPLEKRHIQQRAQLNDKPFLLNIETLKLNSYAIRQLITLCCQIRKRNRYPVKLITRHFHLNKWPLYQPKIFTNKIVVCYDILNYFAINHLLTPEEIERIKSIIDCANN